MDRRCNHLRVIIKPRILDDLIDLLIVFKWYHFKHVLPWLHYPTPLALYGLFTSVKVGLWRNHRMCNCWYLHHKSRSKIAITTNYWTFLMKTKNGGNPPSWLRYCVGFVLKLLKGFQYFFFWLFDISHHSNRLIVLKKLTLVFWV